MTLKTWNIPKCYSEGKVSECGEYSENETTYKVYKTPEGQAVRRKAILPDARKNSESMFLLPLIEKVELE